MIWGYVWWYAENLPGISVGSKLNYTGQSCGLPVIAGRGINGGWYACEAQAAEEDMEESGSTEKEET